jgi:hypothetical protein
MYCTGMTGASATWAGTAQELEPLQCSVHNMARSRRDRKALADEKIGGEAARKSTYRETTKVVIFRGCERRSGLRSYEEGERKERFQESKLRNHGLRR